MCACTGRPRLWTSEGDATPQDIGSDVLEAAKEAASKGEAFSVTLAPAPDRDAFAEASAAALGASDSSALVALRFPPKPKRAAGDKKRVPLRERMAAARGPEQLR